MASLLSGPAGITLTHCASRRVPIANATTGTVTLREASADPLSRVDTGERAEARLRVDLPFEPVLPPGGSCDVVLSVDGNPRPGEYGSTLRVGADAGEPLAIPISVEVSASALLGIACTLAGLVIVGVLGALSGVGGVQARVHDALRDRASIHEWLERNPPPASRFEQIQGMDRDFDTAIRLLSAPRAISFEDHRIADAEPYLTSANAAATELRKALGGMPPGSLEVKDLQAEWQSLRQQLADLSGPTTPQAPDPDMLLARLAAFQARFRELYLLLPMRVLSADLAVQMQRVALAEAAGQGAQAQALATSTRAWMRRAAAELRERVRLVAHYQLSTDQMAATELWIRSQASRPDLSPEALAPAIVKLDRARDMVGPDATLVAIRDAHALIDQADTDLARASSAALKRRVDAALAAETEATGLGEVQTVMDQLTASLAQTPHPTVAQKKAGFAVLFAAWHARLSAQPNQADVADVAAHLATVQQAVAAAETTDTLKAATASYRALMDAWLAYGKRRQDRALAAVMGPYCREMRQRTKRDLARTEEAIKLMNPTSALAGWAAALDATRLDLDAVAVDQDDVAADCLGQLVAISGRANQVSRDVFAATLAETDLPAQSRLNAAERSGVEQAIALAQRLKEGPRPLSIEIRTPEVDRVVNRTLGFALPDLPAAWGSGVTIAVDFGDHSPPLHASAEAIKQGLRIEHQYAAPQTATVSAGATELGHEAGPALGTGSVHVFVAPSPITAARALSDAFLNARFALALLVAAVIYYWRFHNSKKVFGASPFDYAEAFLLGFVVNAAVVDLPARLAALAS